MWVGCRRRGSTAPGGDSWPSRRRWAGGLHRPGCRVRETDAARSARPGGKGGRRVMQHSRRQFLAGAAAATVGATVLGVPTVAAANDDNGKDGGVSPHRIAKLFANLPG